MKRLRELKSAVSQIPPYLDDAPVEVGRGMRRRVARTRKALVLISTLHWYREHRDI